MGDDRPDRQMGNLTSRKRKRPECPLHSASQIRRASDSADSLRSITTSRHSEVSAVGSDGPVNQSADRQPEILRLVVVFRANSPAAWYSVPTPDGKRSMQFLWNEDPEANVDKCAQHGVSQDDWEFAFLNFSDEVTSDSNGRPARIGPAGDGRTLFVVFDLIKVGREILVNPVTGYEIERDL